MKILYDEFGFYQRHGGVSKYFVEVMKHLPSDMRWELTVAKTINPYLQDEPFCVPPMDRGLDSIIGCHLKGLPARALTMLCGWLVTRCPNVLPCDESLNRMLFNEHIKRLDFDVLHVTAPHPRWCLWRDVIGKRPIVATIHDLIPELFYGYDFLVKRMRRKLLHDASHIIAVSSHTKNDLMRMYNVPDDKITVIYHGHSAKDETTCAAGLDLPEKFVLYVGKRCGCKNFDFFIRAFAPMLRNDSSLCLFCTGDPFSVAEKQFFNELGISRQMIHRFVTDGEMAVLLKRARVFVCPSKYEGFGMPILDAFEVGCPVVLARTSCLPEVGGDAALYFDDGDQDGMRSRIGEILNDEGLRAVLIGKGLERARSFSWAKCAAETAKVYRKVCEKWRT